MSPGHSAWRRFHRMAHRVSALPTDVQVSPEAADGGGLLYCLQPGVTRGSIPTKEQGRVLPAQGPESGPPADPREDPRLTGRRGQLGPSLRRGFCPRRPGAEVAESSCKFSPARQQRAGAGAAPVRGGQVGGRCPSLPGLSMGQKTSASPWSVCFGVEPGVPRTEGWELALALPGEVDGERAGGL